MAQENTNKKPEVIVFAGPNGSGKSTVTTLAAIIAPYINADEIRRTIHCTDIEAAQKAEWLRNQSIDRFQSFTFETVMSTRRNLDLLIKAKQAGYFIRTFPHIQEAKRRVFLLCKQILEGRGNR